MKMQRNTIRNKVRYLALLTFSALMLGVESTSAVLDINILTGGSATVIIVVLVIIAVVIVYLRFFRGTIDFGALIGKSKSKK
jgi:hypothetical protein